MDQRNQAARQCPVSIARTGYEVFYPPPLPGRLDARISQVYPPPLPMILPGCPYSSPVITIRLAWV